MPCVVDWDAEQHNNQPGPGVLRLDHKPDSRDDGTQQQIDELKNQNLVGEFISKAAHELKVISYTGAHYSDREVTQGDIRKLEHLLALITTYVYGGRKVDSAESLHEIEDIG